jgi:hypothetical protein
MERMRNAGSGPTDSNRTFASSAEIVSLHMVEVELKHHRVQSAQRRIDWVHPILSLHSVQSLALDSVRAAGCR